ncbi:profilin-4 isoform X3 [Cetorhinus maximus]
MSGLSSLAPLTQLLESSLSDTFKMSEYQDLLTQSLLATSHVQDCAILNLKNASVVTASPGFKVITLSQRAYERIKDWPVDLLTVHTNIKKTQNEKRPLGESSLLLKTMYIMDSTLPISIAFTP